MTQDEIIRMAREAGVYSGANEMVFGKSLERFAALVAAHERDKQAEQKPITWVEDSIELYVSEKPSSTYTIPLYTHPVRTKDLTKTEMLTEAVEAGFMLHTGYGQGVNKMMPVSDSATLVEFARAVIAADREKNK